MSTGTVKWFDDVKGYGFIAPDGGGKDVFCHFTAIVAPELQKILEAGERVSFELVNGKRGMQARKIKHLDSPA